VKKEKKSRELKQGSGKVVFIGAGPGDPDLLTIKGKETIGQAGLIVYAGSLINPEILSYANKTAQLVDSAPLTLDEITSLMIKKKKKGGYIVRIQSGDPSMYGAIAEEQEELLCLRMNL